MMSSSFSEEDTLEYKMPQNLEDSPAVISPPPSSKPEKTKKFKNRDSPSLGGYGCPNLEVPRDLFSLQVVFCFWLFLPSRVGEGALHEKLLSFCLLPASHRQQNTPTCWPCVATHYGQPIRVVHFGPDVSIGRYPNHLAGLPKGIKRRGRSLRVLALRVVTVPGCRFRLVPWNCSSTQTGGRGGQVVRSRPLGRRVPGSKPDSAEDPPCTGPAAR
ncbi:hypothetical protein AVEN_263771-1 [Araneus ventricosus]|uniref:Uncharacterized protein n=1 Tax=Araneus ventricosus TaxID=182803 RepID=A0A4Y2AU63_ARAVE|nr:hypothetical protein AVEN_263771-1 [Araneus ventricosus]